MRQARPTFTYFHALWLAGVWGGAFLGYALPARGTAMTIRLLLAALGLLLGFAVAGIVVFLLVTILVIPRLSRGSIWEYEVNCYMLHMLGKAWDSAGKASPN